MKKEVIKLKESDLEKIAKRIIRESNSQGKAFGMGFTGEFNPEYMEESDEETDRYEKGKYGVRASRSRADYEVGQVSISVIDTNLQIKTCYRSGCAAADTSLVLISTTD